MRVLAFRHEVGGDLGTIRPALAARGIAVECVDLFAGARVPDTAGASGLIYLGGAMCANDDLPFLRLELELIERAAGRGLPVLGICLGAQLIARALGGTVNRSAVQETGWQDIHLAESAASDPVFCSLGPTSRVFQLHDDTFDLPPGAVRLAGSELCRNQAFRWGGAVYGVQFHPEMTPAMVADWSRELALPEWPETEASCVELARTCEKLVHGWSGLL